MTDHAAGGALSYRIVDGPLDVDVTEHVLDDSVSWAALGGCESAELALDLARGDFPTLGSQSRLVVTDSAGRGVWEGYVSDPGDHDDEDGEGLRVAAVGSMVRASDIVAPLVYLDAEMGAWETSPGMPVSGRADVGSLNDAGGDGAQVMQFGFSSGFAIGPGSAAGFDYRRLAASFQDVGGIVFTYSCGVATGYVVDVLALNAAGAASLVASWAATTTAVTRTLTNIPAGTKVLRLQLRRTGAATNVVGESAMCKVTSVVLIGSRVDRFGAAATDAATDLTSADIVEDLIGRGVLADVDASAATIEDSPAVYRQLAFPEGVRGAGVLAALRESDPAMVWAYGSRLPGGFEFSWRRWPTTGRYTLDTTGAGGAVADTIDRPGGEDESCQRVTVYFTTPEGVRGYQVATVADLPPGARIRDADPITMDQPATAAEALARGTTALEELANRSAAGTAVVARMMLDRNTGYHVEPYELRPGHCATVLATGEVVRITSVEWSGAGGSVAQLSIGDTGATLEDKIRAVVAGELLPTKPLIPIPPLRPPPLPIDQPPASDGQPPEQSPTPAVRGGIGTLFVTWDEVENDDPVTVDVYLSTTTPVATTGDSAASVLIDGPGIATFRTLNGEPLAADTTYYVVTVARDVDGVAAPSDAVSGSPVRVTGHDIAAESVTAEHLVAGSVLAEKIAASAVTAGKIAANAVTAEKIAASAITAEKIAANAIQSRHVSVSVLGASMVANGDFEEINADGDPAAWSLVYINGGTAEPESNTTSPIGGERSARISVGAGTTGWVYCQDKVIPVVSGQRWFVSVQVRGLHADARRTAFLRFHTAIPGVDPMVLFDNRAAWNEVQSAPVGTIGTMTLSGIVTVPTGHTVAKVSVAVYASTALGATAIDIEEAIAFPAVASEQITSISPGKIETGVLAASTRIIAGSLGGARVELNGNGLEAYRADGTQTVAISAATGDVSLSGVFTTRAGAGVGRVALSAIANPWQGDQTWNTIQFFSNNPSWAPGLIWSAYQAGSPNWGELDLVSPRLGTRAPARFRLRSEEQTNETYALTEANRIESSGNLFLFGDPTGSSLLFRMKYQGTGMQQRWAFQSPGGRTMVIDWNTAGRTLLQTTNEDGNLERLDLRASDIMLNPSSANGQLQVSGASSQSSRVALGAADANVALVYVSGALRVMTLNGSDYRPIGASAFSVNSDAREKTDERLVTNVLSKVRTVPAYDYRTRHGTARKSAGRRPPKGFAQRGLMAQDLQHHWPDSVTEDSETGALSVDMYYALSTLWAAFLELDHEVTTLKNQGAA